ncbi:polysaccharide pyruvyl transferase family protein [Ornithinimicrobium panacihumi]|uniref:polysaccharide pyruvyl transferase family protein n=1 Tax=Ornithinimicrobium panacihumi TaxID=2008449 RepID=UPI003F89F495
MTKRIALVGFFGWGNFGDELFVDAHRQMLEPKYELFVANDLTAAPYFSEGVQPVVDHADAVLVGGGDLINPAQVSQLYWKQEFLQKPTFVYGIGVPSQPFTRKPVMDHYARFLQHDNCKLVVARDVESHDWLAKNFDLGDRLHWYPDAVCAYRRPPAVRTTEKIFGIVMREHRSLDSDMSHVRAMADEAKRLGYTVRHLVLSNKVLAEGDLGRAKLIATPDEEIFHSDSLEEMCIEISKCTLLASIKFHGMVVATMYGVPTIAMSVTPKNKNFLRMIQRPEMAAGYRDPHLKDRVTAHPAKIHTLVRGNLHRRAVAGYEVLKDALAQHLDE